MPAPVIAAGVGGLGSILGGLLSGHSQNDAQQQQADLQNQYLQRYGQGQNDYRNYLKGLGPQTSYSNSLGNSNSNTSQAGTSTTDPHVTAQFQPLVGQLTSMLQNRLSGPNSMPQGYVQNQIRNINDTFSGVQQANQNMAARFGMSGPQAAAGNIPLQQARAGQIANFQSQVPLTARALQDQDMQMAQNLSSIFGKGQTTNSAENSRTNGITQTAGSMTAPPPIAPYQAFLPQGPQQGGPVDPTANMVMGGLGASGNLQQTIMDWLGQRARQNAGQTSNPGWDPGPQENYQTPVSTVWNE